ADRTQDQGPIVATDQGRIDNYDKNKEYYNKIISIDKQEQPEGPIAGPGNVSQVSQASQNPGENGDISDKNKNNVSQASHFESSNTIYRLGRSDIFACQNCRLRGDKWEMRKHPCNGAKK